MRVYAGVVNDKAYGGVFASTDGGAQWKHLADGLDGRDVFALAQSPDGEILAGTNSGIFALDDGTWQSGNKIANTSEKPVNETVRGHRVTVEKRVKEQLRELDSRVYALDLRARRGWRRPAEDYLPAGTKAQVGRVVR